MNKKYLFSVVFIFMLLLSGSVFAEENETKTIKIDEAREKLLDLKQRALEERAEARARLASTTEKLKEKRKELKSDAELKLAKKLEERKAKVVEVFEKALENVKNLIERIASRISKMEAESINVAEAKVLLETARSKFTLAETELANLENMLLSDIPSGSTSTERKSALKSLNAQSEKAKTAIKAAHKATVDVISSLKRGLMKSKTSTSTQNDDSETNN